MAVVATIPISQVMHPLYKRRELSWHKWRLCFEGGDSFIDEYLQQFSKSESREDFAARKLMTYAPSFAKAAIIEVRNSVYQRLADISRVGGSATYQTAMAGKEGGVDNLGSSMNTFMGTEVLEELLVMGKVGIYVDMPPINGPTIADNAGVRPYLYAYRAEDIRSWADDESPLRNQYKAVLLRDVVCTHDNELNLPSGETERYRYYWRDANGEIWVQFYSITGLKVGPDGESDTGPIRLNLKRIPFVTLDLNNSLMCDIANYQIAMLNLASTDMAYATGANFPFYTEQFDPREGASHLKQVGDYSAENIDPEVGGVIVNDGNIQNNDVEIKSGPASGRRYGKGLERPGFVHPSSEPMKASMEKQHQLMKEIRLLINLTIADLQAKGASAESKGLDDRTLESGLSYIGLIMEDAERQVAEIWHQYEKEKTPYEVTYPSRYSLRNQADIDAEVKQLKEQLSTVPSITYQRSIAKRIAELLVGHRITLENLKKIYSEIDKAKVVVILIEKIEKDVAGGYLDPELAAELRGYPVETVEKAQKFRIERIKETQLAQTKGVGFGRAAAAPGDLNPADGLKNPAARGNPDLSANPKQDVAAEKDAAGNPVRGKSN
jgi:hypothetical protein